MKENNNFVVVLCVVFVFFYSARFENVVRITQDTSILNSDRQLLCVCVHY